MLFSLLPLTLIPVLPLPNFPLYSLATTSIRPPSTTSLTEKLGGRCNQRDDWIGDGILASDCQVAIDELYWDDVVPRQGQEFEFLRRGVRHSSALPWVTTPRKHWFGTCVVEIVMLDTFVPGTLPGEPSDLPTLRADTSTFDMIYAVAIEIFTKCVKRRSPYAGWGWAGKVKSIGVFILRHEGPLDKSLVRDQMLDAFAVNGSSLVNGTLSSGSTGGRAATA